MTRIEKHKMTKGLIYVLLMVLSFRLSAQQISPQVINSAGNSTVMGSMIYSDNIGEPFTETLGPVSQMMISQGFLQPSITDGLSILVNHLTCSSRDDGFISVSYSSLNSKHSETYIWSPPGVCPNGCGNKVSNLRPGKYSVTVVSTYTANGVTRSDTIRSLPIEVKGSDLACLIHVYTGVTANKDGVNDRWQIDNITEFPDNRVWIYNRWGAEVFSVKGYDNETKYWPTDDLLNKLSSSTYFYVIELGDGSKPVKGWVELIKN
jgi:gliding motility-associated-like protein